jgi:hypothetical protein
MVAARGCESESIAGQRVHFVTDVEGAPSNTPVTNSNVKHEALKIGKREPAN